MIKDFNAAGKQFLFREANWEEDIDYAYNLFKKTTIGFVEQLTQDRKWPEASQREAFEETFANPDMQVVLCNGEKAGYFSISYNEEENAVILERLYLEENIQGYGIGKKVLAEALRQAHEHHVPLELTVLKTNQRAGSVWKHLGFRMIEVLDHAGAEKHSWVIEYKMRHRDTEQYACDFRGTPPEPER